MFARTSSDGWTRLTVTTYGEGDLAIPAGLAPVERRFGGDEGPPPPPIPSVPARSAGAASIQRRFVQPAIDLIRLPQKMLRYLGRIDLPRTDRADVAGAGEQRVHVAAVNRNNPAVQIGFVWNVSIIVIEYGE